MTRMALGYSFRKKIRFNATISTVLKIYCTLLYNSLIPFLYYLIFLRKSVANFIIHSFDLYFC